MADIVSKLTANRTLIGLNIMYPSPGVVERIAPDWDFIWVDGQHGQIGYSEMLNLVRACDLVNVPALVRIPWLEFGAVGMVLDSNAAGVIVPCVDSVEEAKAAVAAAKFPPLGRRSYGGRRPIDRQGRGYAHNANVDRLLIVQIESPQAIENAQAIASIPGVDALFLGPDDVMLRRGHAMDAPRTAAMLEPDMRAVSDACKQHGKFSMSVAIGAEMFNLHTEMGFNLLVAGGDVPFLANGSKAAAGEARSWLAGRSSSSPAAGGKSVY